MKTPEHRIKAAADVIAEELKKGAEEDAIRLSLTLAGVDADDLDRAFELAKKESKK